MGLTHNSDVCDTVCVTMQFDTLNSLNIKVGWKIQKEKINNKKSSLF